MSNNIKQRIFGLSLDNPSTQYILVLGVFLLWVSTPFLTGWIAKGILNGNGNTMSTQGQIGDLFGAINALFSGLAFAMIIYTILIQREELNAQREELQLTRDELKLTREEAELQTKTMHRQAFENTFFNLLRSNREMAIRVTALNYESRFQTGYEAFDLLNAKITEGIKNANSASQIVLEGAYHVATERSVHTLSQYTFSLTTLLEYLERQSNFNEGDKKFYRQIAVSNMTYGEAIFVDFYKRFGVSNEVRPLIERAISEYNFVQKS